LYQDRANPLVSTNATAFGIISAAQSKNENEFHIEFPTSG